MSEQTAIYVAKTLDCLVGTFVERLDHDDLLAYCLEYEVETNFDSTLDDDWPDETDRSATELAAAMVKAYEDKAIHTGRNARTKKLETACIKASDEIVAWDFQTSTDYKTSLGYAVKILRAAVHPG